MKNLLVTLLALVMLVSVFAACQKGGSGGTDDTTAAPITTPEGTRSPETTADDNLDPNGFVKDNLPITSTSTGRRSTLL